METIKKLEFKKVDGTAVEDVERYVKDWIRANPFGKIIVACDSQIHGRRVKYSVIIVMHYVDVMEVGHGAHVILADVWERRVARTPIEEMPSKLWREAEYALAAAEAVDGNDDSFKKRIEVHLDFNSEPRYKSNVMFAAGMGLLQSVGYRVLGKPFAIYASNGADHWCK